MALTALQRDVCRLLADNRIASGESYVAGGAALNELLPTSRLSRDLDLFHDTEEALAATWESDRRLLEAAGYALRVFRERPTFVEAEAVRDGESVLLQWSQDSAYRFFPLVQSDVFGLTLHPFDLATNKFLALVGRVEARDCFLRMKAAAACSDPPMNCTAVGQRPSGTTLRPAGSRSTPVGSAGLSRASVARNE